MVSGPEAVFNVQSPFPPGSGLHPAVWTVAAVTAGLLVLGAALHATRSVVRRAAVRREALLGGLTRRSADFLAGWIGPGSDGDVRTLVRSPRRMKERLSQGMAVRRPPERMAAFADAAARLAAELRLLAPIVPAAPPLFAAVTLRHATDPGGPAIAGWVSHVAEGTLTVVSGDGCPWPARTSLLVTPAAGEPFEARLLLPPFQDGCEWVLGHELAYDGCDRRAAERSDCRLETWLLGASRSALTLRRRLQDGEELGPGELVALAPPAERIDALVLDISSAGARIATDRRVLRGEPMYLALPEDDRGLAALPLCDVVSVRGHDDSGRHVVGVQFRGVRLSERLVLASYARQAAASWTPARAAEPPPVPEPDRAGGAPRELPA